MKNRTVKRIAWFCVVAVLLYAAWVILTNFQENLHTLVLFPWQRLPLILGAVLLNLAIRELKWDYFRRAADMQVPRFGSFLVFFSGFSMAISPGRVGELIKPFMYKEYFGQKMRRSIPLVFCERISDLLGMILLAGITLAYYVSGVAEARNGSSASANVIYGFLGISLIAMIALLSLMRSKRLVYAILHWVTGHRMLRSSSGKLRRLYFSTYPLLTVRNLLLTTLMGAVSWFFECVAFKMILDGVGANVGLGEASFIFCMATIFGGFLFFAPGGLGGFEGSAKVMLSLLALPNFKVVPAILILRFCTLFFSVALGFLFILFTSIRYHKALQWEEFEHVDQKA